MQYDNTNRGTLGKNMNKTADNHPDYSGSINVGGNDYWLSGWVKEGRDGKKFFSLSIKPKDQKKPAAKQQRSEDDFNDPIPF